MARSSTGKTVVFFCRDENIGGTKLVLNVERFSSIFLNDSAWSYFE
jgi:hypothetical protein